MKILIFVISVLTIFSSTAQISQPQRIAKGELPFQSGIFTHIDQDSIIDILYHRGEGIPSTNSGGLYQGLGYYAEGELRWNSEKIAEKNPDHLMVIDIDHDGTEELIASYGENNNPCTEVYENINGLYQLTSKGSTFFDTLCLVDPKALDVNGDGITDIYAGTGSQFGNSSYSVFLQREEGVVLFDEKIITQNGRPFGFGYFNQDSIIDFMTSNSSEKTLSLHLFNTLNETFNEPIVVDTNYRSSRVDLSYIGDMDYDGDVEMFYRNPVTDTLYRLDTFYHGSMSIAQPFLPLDFGTNWWYDMNFDGFVDFAFRDGIVYINDGAGNLTPDSISYPLINDYIYDYQDISKDSALLLFSAYDGITYSKGKWDTFRYHFSEYQIGSVDDVELVDVDNNGIKDLVVASRWAHKFLWFKGNGNGDFGEAQILIPEEGAYDIAFDDLNGDGITDIMFSAIWSDKLSVKYGKGDGQYTDRIVLVDEAYLLRGSDLGDFDLDGYPDIVYTVLTQGKTYIIRNNEGVFSEPEVLTDNFDPESVIIRDFTGDGYPDIWVYGYSGLSIYFLLENDQSGGFLPAVMNFGTSSRNLTWTDFDADGIDELVSPANGAVYISKYNEGQYTPWLVAPIQDFFNDVYVLDYNGDGYKDLITGRSLNSSPHHLYLNQNNENFVYDDEFSNLFNFSLPSIGTDDYVSLDIDQDGDIDLLYSDGQNLMLIEDQRFDPSFTGATFWDIDGDSIYTESADVRLSGVKVEAENDIESLQSFSNRNGYYRFFLDTVSYDVTGYPLNECWTPINSEATSVVGSRDSTTLHHIGFWSSDSEGEDVDIFRSNTPMRCLFPVKHWVTLKNNSCLSFNGPFTYKIDSKLTDIRLISLDDHVLDGHTIRVENLDLQPGEEVKFHFTATGPAVDFIGQQVIDILTMKYVDPITGLDTLELKQVFQETIRCAYDPNDKLVFPDRSEEYGNTYVTNEYMHYTIRFQNTGNDTAFNVYLLDTLEEKLDLSTFRPVDASHDHEISLDPQSRILRIDFRNILLPDSTTNLIGSNGFFSFKIKPVEGLSDFDEIENNAVIYFDFNPPIITNTTHNTFVEDLSTLISVDEPIFTDNEKFQIYPNPTGDLLYHNGKNIKEIQISDVMGRVVLSGFPQEKDRVDVSNLYTGFYSLTVFYKGGNTDSISFIKL